MADQVTAKPDVAAPATEGKDAPATEPKPDQQELGKDGEAKTEEKKEEPAKDNGESKEEEQKPAAEEDSEMPDAGEASMLDADQSLADTTANKTPAKANNNRRKSTGGKKSGGKKGAKAKVFYLDAKPGDHFLVKLKGYPDWPAVVIDEEMLPDQLKANRPTTAKQADGTYNENYADGGKRVGDRKFPVMYLHTNEFGWVVNTDFQGPLTAELAEETINKGTKLRKDLRAAFELAVEQHDLDHYKEVLDAHKQMLEEDAAIKAAAAATPKKSKKKGNDDDDVDMADSVKSKAKKRKAEDETPQRSDSVKKPKIKLNTSTNTPKANNGSAAKDSSAKKMKQKKGDKKDAPQDTPEERLARKQKEVLYLRYKLQRGLLSKDAPPKAEEMKSMAEYISMLENMPKLEAVVIKETRIYKVMKQIIKLSNIPHEEEYQFKSRSQKLLDGWNKTLASDESSANGVNGAKESPAEEKTNGDKTEATKEPKEPEKAADEAEKADSVQPEKTESAQPESEKTLSVQPKSERTLSAQPESEAEKKEDSETKAEASTVEATA